MLPSAPSSTLTVMSSAPLRCGNFICNTVRILVLPSGSVSLLILATDFDLEIVENDCFKNSVLPWGSMEVSGLASLLSMEVCTISMEVTWMVLKGGWLYAMCTFGHLVTSWPGLLTFALVLASSGCAAGLSVQSSRLSGPTLHTKMILISTFMTLFAPYAGHSLGGWDVPHLPHILPLLLVRALARDPWPFLVKVLISLIVVDVATPPLDLCRWKSLTVASCCFACCNSFSKVTVSFRAVCNLTHFFTSKCFITWNSSSSQHLSFSSLVG